MGDLSIKTVFFLFIFCLTGCANYRIPIETDNHPSMISETISQIQLSPLLDILESGYLEKLEDHDCFDYD